MHPSKIKSTGEGGRSASDCSPLEVLRKMGLKGVEYSKRWNKIHPERMKEARDRWGEAHPEKVRRKNKESREKWRENGGRFKSNARYYAGAEKAKLKGQQWDIVDECMVLDRKMPDKELAEILGRSVRAIQIRRCKLMKEENAMPTDAHCWNCKKPMENDSRPTVDDLYLACKSLPYKFDEMDHRDIILGIVEKCYEIMSQNS